MFVLVPDKCWAQLSGVPCRASWKSVRCVRFFHCCDYIGAAERGNDPSRVQLKDSLNLVLH